MKTREELNVIREECENLNRKLHELDERELEQVAGGFIGFHFDAFASVRSKIANEAIGVIQEREERLKD